LYTHQILLDCKNRENEKAGHVARIGRLKIVCKALVAKPEVKKALERPRRRWENNIKMNIQEFVCGLD
jgi:hypothetical protein